MECIEERARRPHLDAQDLSPATTGKPRLAATTRRVAAVDSKTPEADASRPDLLGLVATRKFARGRPVGAENIASKTTVTGEESTTVTAGQ